MPKRETSEDLKQRTALAISKGEVRLNDIGFQVGEDQEPDDFERTIEVNAREAQRSLAGEWMLRDLEWFTGWHRFAACCRIAWALFRRQPPYVFDQPRKEVP
jgi:hypothetical protein